MTDLEPDVTAPPARTTLTELTGILAECHQCGWQGTAPNAQGIAARHHDATGHVVTVTVTRTITYGDAADLIDPNQLTL